MFKKYSFFLLMIGIFLLKSPILSKINPENKETIATLTWQKEASEKQLKELEENLKLTSIENVIASYMIRINPYTFYTEATVLKGKKDGVTENQAVIMNGKLIGIVKEVKEDESTVWFLNHKDLKLSVRIENSYGILEYQKGEYKIHSINNLEQIQEGMEVYTSGLTSIPGELYIGKVKTIENSLGIEQTLTLEDMLTYPSSKVVFLVGVSYD